MLISFKVANFLSFNEEVELSMVAGLTRSMSHHVIKAYDRNDLNILKAAIIYGANASGKSNLIKAMDFGRTLIVKGTKAKSKIPIKYFKLQSDCEKRLSEFQYDFKHKGRIYSYRFSVNSNIVKYETLQEIKKGKDNLLFSRETMDDDFTKVAFPQKNKLDKEESEFLNYVAKGTRPNQLFLTESIERNVKYYQDVYEWFDKKLNIIFPLSQLAGLEEIFSMEEKSLKDSILLPLKEFDTNIADLFTIETPIYKLDMSEETRAKIEQKLTKNKNVFAKGPEGQRYSFKLNEKKELIALKLCTKHNVKNSKQRIIFDLTEESDGTRRMIDLIPALTALYEDEDIFIIDEIDRSLHPHITKKIVEMFLNASPQNNNQLIVTTHESGLLDLNLIRKDEIWFIAKNKDGESNVYSLEEYKPRYDKDIRKGYLLGRFGAIPILKKRKIETVKSKMD
jgi:uncharacterized protein